VLRLRTFGGLWIETVDGSRLPNPRPRRLALLAVLASAGQRGITRGRLQAIFWPDADNEPARHALSQTIYALRRDLGSRAIIADADLRLDPDNITCDTDDFRAAVVRRDWSTAYLAYQGPFAEGFSLDDSPEFDRWLEEERAGLARQAESALEAVALEAEAAGDRHRAVEVRKRLAGLDPLSGRFAASYMSALVALGDRSGAMAHGRSYAALVKQELDAEPDPIIARLAADLRGVEPTSAGEKATPASPAANVGGAAREQTPSADPSAASPREAPGAAAPGLVDRDGDDRSARATPWSSRRLALAGITVALLGAIAVAGAAWRSSRSVARPPVLAVGQLRDLTAPDSARQGGVLSEVLATSIARLSEVEVIANSRILELLEQGKDTLRSARSDAARRAGATEILEGELVPAVGGLLRLDLRRIQIGRGAVRGGYSVSGTDRLALIDSVTLLLAADLRIGRPRRPLAEVTPRSPVALRLYEEGLRAFYQSDPEAALGLFREALLEDSTFAMAAYYAYRSGIDVDGRDPVLEARALRLSARAPDRDRLIIETSIRAAQHDPTAPLFGDTLVARFPRDPEALIRAADASSTQNLIGPRERELFERAIAIDSAAGLQPKAPCRLCLAFATFNYHLQFADSASASESVIRRSMVMRPADPGPVVALAMQQFELGRYEAGASALAKLDGLPSPQSLAGPIFIGRLLTGRLDEADAECMVHLGQEDPRTIDSYRWLCAIVWRNQGRYQDAAALVFSGRLPGGGGELKVRRPRDVVGEVVLDLEMDRPTAVLRALETVVPTPGSLPPGQFAREMTWNLARRGTAAAMAREYELARRLADSAEVIGRGSLFGRDPRLHYFIRGLIARGANDHQTAVDFFRRSIFSWNFGYTRANLELARSLLALGRAAEAIHPLQASLRGGWDGSNLYVTRTELRELLAQAFVATGRGDSAAAHYAAVERAWRRADPPFAARYQAARDFLTRQVAAKP
jgi:DNA-binding SARP family transcriptional activator